MRNTQQEYTELLDSVNARGLSLTQAECEQILMEDGYTFEQAKNGAYVYLYHGDNLTSKKRGSKEEYGRILDEFRAHEKQPKDCIAHLEGMGFSYRQAQTAVYNFRKERSLIRR